MDPNKLKRHRDSLVVDYDRLGLWCKEATIGAERVWFSECDDLLAF